MSKSMGEPFEERLCTQLPEILPRLGTALIDPVQNHLSAPSLTEAFLFSATP